MQNYIEHIITISRWFASQNIKNCSKCKHAHVCLCALNTTLFMLFGGDETIPKQLMLAYIFFLLDPFSPIYFAVADLSNEISERNIYLERNMGKMALRLEFSRSHSHVHEIDPSNTSALDQSHFI